MSNPKKLAKVDREMITSFNQINYFKYLLFTFSGKGTGDNLKINMRKKSN